MRLPAYAEVAGVPFTRRGHASDVTDTYQAGVTYEKSLAQEEPVYEHVAERGQYRAEFGAWPGDG